MTGSFATGGKATAAGDLALTTISFPFALPTQAAVTVIPEGGAPTANCPGTVAAPQSTPGRLCVYEGYREGDPSTVLLFSPITGNGSQTGVHGATLFTLSSQAGNYDVSGSWSATA